MTEATLPAPGRRDIAAIVLSSIVVPLPLLFGAGLEAALDAVNPAGIDVSRDSAYLRELLGFGFGFLGVLLIAVAATYTHVVRRDRSTLRLRLPLIVLSINLLIGVLFLLLTALGTTIENGYSLNQL